MKGKKRARSAVSKFLPRFGILFLAPTFVLGRILLKPALEDEQSIAREMFGIPERNWQDGLLGVRIVEMRQTRVYVQPIVSVTRAVISSHLVLSVQEMVRSP